MTLRALRRDLVVLTAAAGVSIGLSAWIHAHTCPLESGPPRPAAQVVAVAPTPTEVVAPAAAAPLRYGEHFAFVVDLEEPYLVLATEVDVGWEGDFEGLLGVDTVFRGVDEATLPEHLRAARGRTFTLWTTEEGGRPVALGTAEIGAPRLVAQAAGSLGTDPALDTWSLHERLERDGVLPPKLRAKVEAAIWDDGLRLLVAPLRGARASEATWARAAELDPPSVLHPVSLPVHEASALHRAFFEHPEGKAAAEQHAAMGHGLLLPHLVDRGWADADGELRLATTFIDSPYVDVCGGFDGTHAIAAPIDGADWGLPVTIPTHHTSGPALVADFNDDGYPDVLLEPRALDGDATLLRGTEEGLDVVETLGEVPYFGCRC